MDIISAASVLRSQLVALHNIDTTVSQLEHDISSLGQQSLLSAIEDNHSSHLHVLLRLSVNEGVCHMYKKYSTRKLAEVQNTARSIKSSLEADNSEQTTPVMTSSPTGGSTSHDKAVDAWTSVYCEHSRCE